MAHDPTTEPDATPADDPRIDPGLADLVDAMTARLLGGEAVDSGDLAGADPGLADAALDLLPAMRGLAGLGRPGPADLTGDAFGDFRIVREVGRGGMGVVYEAEQAATRSRVALKVLPQAAALDRRALQRFRLEAQVAGWLRHPRIVSVHDVGLAGGVPYYTMPFIEGGSLAEVIAALQTLADGRAGADGSAASALAVGLASGRFDPEPGPGSDAPPTAPPTRGRPYLRAVARLGVQAAEALEYAHDQGVVHRDIKPANLLLDLRGELWVADFGMADVPGDAGLTRTGELPGTLRYMSPEQALGRRALVDRRTDLYSLGVTLYELLTLRPAVPGSDRQEVLRRVVEELPAPVRRLNPAVPVDLATILARAMAKDPSGRYETARHLRDDLERFLDGRPIAARPVGPAARAWGWCRRKPLRAALAASIALALAVGVAGVGWNWREAVRQGALLARAEREARAQAARADAINRFLIDGLLVQAEPAHSPADRRVTLLEVLDRAAEGVGTAFEGQPDVEATLRLAIGRIYHGLGEFARSESHHRAAVALFDRLPDGPGQGRLEALAELGHALTHLGRPDEAEAPLVAAAEGTRRALGPSHPVALRSAAYLAGLHRDRGRLAEAEALFERCLDDARRAESPDADLLFSARFQLGDVYLGQGRAAEAEALYRDTLDDQRRRRGPRHPGTLTTMNNLAAALQRQARHDEAEPILRECLEAQREVLGPHHPDAVTTLYNLGHVLLEAGRAAEAEPILRESVEGRRRGLGPEHPGTLYVTSTLGSALASLGRADEARPILRDCLEAQRRVLGPDHSDTSLTARRLDALGRAPAGPDAPLAGPDR